MSRYKFIITLKSSNQNNKIILFSSQLIKWKKDFPQKFRVKINGKIFMPTQSAIVDPSSDTVLFHAALMQ